VARISLQSKVRVTALGPDRLFVAAQQDVCNGGQTGRSADKPDAGPKAVVTPHTTADACIAPRGHDSGGGCWCPFSAPPAFGEAATVARGLPPGQVMAANLMTRRPAISGRRRTRATDWRSLAKSVTASCWPVFRSN
jgi:hypothetical protein